MRPTAPGVTTPLTPSARMLHLPGPGGVVAVHPTVARVEVTVTLITVEPSTVPGDLGRIGAVGAVLMDLTPVAPHFAAVAADLSAVVACFGTRGGGLRAGRRRASRGGGRGLGAAPGGEAEGQGDEQWNRGGTHLELR